MIKNLTIGVPFIFASILFATVCSVFYSSQEVIFAFNGSLALLLIFLIATVTILAVTASLVAMLVRPISFALLFLAVSGVVVAISVKGGAAFSLLAFSGYFVAGSLYFMSVKKEITSRINFTTSALRKGQGFFIIVIMTVVALNFGLGYRDDSQEKDYIIPPIIRESVADFIFRQANLQIEDESSLEEATGGTLDEAREEIEIIITEVEDKLNSFGQIWVALVFATSSALNFFHILIAFVSQIIAKISISLLTKGGVIKIRKESVERSIMEL